MANKCLCITDSTIFSWFLYSEKTSASCEKIQGLIDTKKIVIEALLFFFNPQNP